MSRRNWVVSIAQEEDDPLLFGPYVEQRAKALAERFNEVWGQRAAGDDWAHAGAYPLDNPGIRGILAEFGVEHH